MPPPMLPDPLLDAIGNFASVRIAERGCLRTINGRSLRRFLVKTFPLPRFPVLLPAIAPRKLQFPFLPEWRNWQTRQVEGLVPSNGSAGSSPVSGTAIGARGYGEAEPLALAFCGALGKDLVKLFA